MTSGMTSGMGGGYGFSQDRQGGSSGRDQHPSTDRYGGFGGPNRPDMSYGQQYGGRSERY